MRGNFCVVFGVLCTLLMRRIHAEVYMIDPVSCPPGSPKAIFVQQAMEGAMAMARAGMNGISSATATPAQNDLTRWLLGSLAKGDATVGGIFSLGGGAQRFRTKVTDESLLTQSDLKIYCDQSRLEVRARDPLHFYDPDTDGAASAWVKVQCGSWVLAYTVEPDWDTGKGYYQIQLCPWFVDYGTTVDYPVAGSLEKVVFEHTRTQAIAKVANAWYTPIDIFSLSDKIFLHEITHARKEDLATDDVGPFPWSGYGWENCRGLSTSTNPNRLPENNADTWALYGSASLIIQNTQGVVNADGTFVQG